MFDFFKKKDDSGEKKDFFNLKEIVSKTSESLVKNVLDFVKNEEKIDEFTLDEIETLLIKADLGVDFAVEIVSLNTMSIVGVSVAKSPVTLTVWVYSLFEPCVHVVPIVADSVVTAAFVAKPSTNALVEAYVVDELVE